MQPLHATKNRFGDMFIHVDDLPESARDFEHLLQEALDAWKQEDIKVIWLKIPSDKSDLIPVAIAAHQIRLPVDRVRAATEVLIATGEIQRDALRKELTDLTKELKESKAKDAPKYVEALEFATKIVKGIRTEQE